MSRQGVQQEVFLSEPGSPVCLKLEIFEESVLDDLPRNGYFENVLHFPSGDSDNESQRKGKYSS